MSGDFFRYMHPISGYGEMKGESSDLVRYMLSGPKIIFREFFRPATLKISSFEIYWIRLIWKSLFLSSNLSEIRLKIASWVPQMRVPSQFPLGFHVNSIRRGLDIGRTYRDVGRDWRTIAQLFVWLKRSEHGDFQKCQNIKPNTSKTLVLGFKHYLFSKFVFWNVFSQCCEINLKHIS